MKELSPSRWQISPEWYKRQLLLESSRDLLPSPSRRPLLSIIMPCYNTSPDLLCSAIESVLNQTYSNWQLCITDDGSESEIVREILCDYRARDGRIEIQFMLNNQGISAASNQALCNVRGEFTLLMDHDDELTHNALSTVVKYISDNPDTKFAYSDSDHLDNNGNRCRPFYKPEWDYDLFLSQNYLNHLTIVQTRLLKSIGGWRDGFEGSQDYDLYLRIVEQTNKEQILHIPHILYHWREVSSSVARSNIGKAVLAARKSIADHLTRRGKHAIVSASPGALVYNRIIWKIPAAISSVLVIEIQSPNSPKHGDSKSIPVLTSSGAVRTLRIDLNSCCQKKTIEKIKDAAIESTPDVVCLVNSDIEFPTGKWLDQIVAVSMRSDVGCVGCKYTDMDNVLLNIPNQASDKKDADHLYTERWKNAHLKSKGYFFHLLLDQSTDILRPDIVAFRYQHLANFDNLEDHCSSLHLAIAQLCLSTCESGFQAIWLANPAFRIERKFLIPEIYSSGQLKSFRGRWKNLLSTKTSRYKHKEWEIAH